MADISGLKERVEEIRQEILKKADSMQTVKEAYDTKIDYLDSKRGKISALMKDMRSIPADQRRSERFSELDARMKQKELAARYEAEQIDVTKPAVKMHPGHLHPVTQVREELIDVFSSMGFEIYEGSEVETDYYNFTALNTPKDHPARDMQDTFYLSPEFLLRTQTSSGQIHVMENKKPPIKILSPGKVFRADDDATHSPMFSQMEGLVVDRHITLSDLKGMLDVFAEKIFGEGTTTRLRPSYFPFTEPSVEVDVSCFACGGKGCSLVNRKVLANCGIDPEEYSGLAFGIGLERTAMLKYGIGNIKLLFESDVNVLNQIGDQT